MIESDTIPVIAGDVFSQSSSIPAGNNVFTVTGLDSIEQGPFSAAGILDTDGAGNIKSDSVEDINDTGTSGEIGAVTGQTITGSYAASGAGRYVITLTSFVNGEGGNGCVNCQFAAYPSTGGTQLLEIDDGGVTDGVAYAQGSSPTFASGQGYAMNLSGNNGVEEDDIAEFTNTNGTLAGHVDFNDEGTTDFGETYTSTYAADSTVSGRGVVTPTNANSFNLVIYVVDGSSAVFVETDSTQVGIGSLGTQSASASSNAAARLLTVLRLKPGAKGAKTKLKRRFN